MIIDVESDWVNAQKYRILAIEYKSKELFNNIYE